MSSVINLKEVKYGRNKYHLCFKGYVPRQDPNWLYEFDFIGTDVSTNAYLPEKEKQQFKEQLVKDFGYAPYDIRKVKKIFGNGREHMVDFE